MILTRTVSIRAKRLPPAAPLIDSPVVEEDTDDEDVESVGFSVSDDTARNILTSAQAAVVRLEKALGALDDADIVAKQALQSALLEWARARATERGLKERTKEGRGFCRTGWEAVGECRRQHCPSRGSVEGASGWMLRGAARRSKRA